MVHGDHDQRSRLLRSLARVAARAGFAHAKVAEIAREAGVSLATFYALFENKEQCLVEAQRVYGQQLIERVLAASEAAVESPVMAALTSLIELADREPDEFVVLFHEGPLAGGRALEQHDRLMTDLERAIDRALMRTPQMLPTPDLPTGVLIGGLTCSLAIHIRRGDVRPGELRADLMRWVAAYARPRSEHRCAQMLALGRSLDDVLDHHARVMLSPPPLPNGPDRVAPAVLRRVRREGMQYAAAHAIGARGYAHVTVSDIVKTAKVSREAFYACFHGKRDAADHAAELVFSHIMGVTAGAFYRDASWPEQVWAAGRAFLKVIVASPRLTRFALVEGYGFGPEAARRTDEQVLAFTSFLEGGFHFSPQAATVPRIASTAIAATILHMITRCVHDGTVAELPYLLPLVCYIVLAPFTGTDYAYDFIRTRNGAQKGSGGAAVVCLRG